MAAQPHISTAMRSIAGFITLNLERKADLEIKKSGFYNFARFTP
jgi:hypothetical protein